MAQPRRHRWMESQIGLMEAGVQFSTSSINDFYKYGGTGIMTLHGMKYTAPSWGYASNFPSHSQHEIQSDVQFVKSKPIRDLGRLSKEERQIVENSDDPILKEKMKAGDDAHLAGDDFNEAINHIAVQDGIKISQKNNVRHTNPEAKHAWAWNKAHQHNQHFIDTVKLNYGMKFEDNFYYDESIGQYYMTDKAIDFAKNNGIEFNDKGLFSVIPTTSKYSIKRSREYGRMTNNDVQQEKSKPVLHACWASIPGYSNSEYVTIKPHSESECSFPPFGTQEAKDYCDAVRKIRGY